MGRSTITDRTIQLNSDSGAVLWSLVQGEQREFPITIDSLENINGYTFKAVVIEAANALTSSVPTTVKTGGVTTTLSLRVPLWRGAWSPATAYNYDDVVEANGVTYRKDTPGPTISDSSPDLDPGNWVAHTHNVIYVRFASDFGNMWSPQPTPIRSVYGFFELSVTEPASSTAYVQTYKPVRGLVESLFSPTDLTS